MLSANRRDPHDEPAQQALGGELLGTVCHDLRDPLSAIVMGTDLLLKQCDTAGDGRPPPVQRTAEAIQRAAARMTRILADYHDLALLERRALDLALTSREVGPLLEEASVPIRASLARANLRVRLVLEAPAERVTVRCDSGRFVEILDKLVRNAADASPPDSEVRISWERAGEEVLFRVKDRGLGVSPEVLPHLFDVRWLASRRARRSTGLGLGVARGLIEAHEGTLLLEETGPRGSTFAFTLPRG